MRKRFESCDPYQAKWLQDPVNAAAFLNSVFEENDKEAFLMALRDIAEAQGGMSAVAERTHVSRSTLYKTLSKEGNPVFSSISKLLQGLGLRLTVEPDFH
jgi:probable addiction module antidote protein